MPNSAIAYIVTTGQPKVLATTSRTHDVTVSPDSTTRAGRTADSPTRSASAAMTDGIAVTTWPSSSWRHRTNVASGNAQARLRLHFTSRVAGGSGKTDVRVRAEACSTRWKTVRAVVPRTSVTSRLRVARSAC